MLGDKYKNISIPTLKTSFLMLSLRTDQFKYDCKPSKKKIWMQALRNTRLVLELSDQTPNIETVNVFMTAATV